MASEVADPGIPAICGDKRSREAGPPDEPNALAVRDNKMPRAEEPPLERLREWLRGPDPGLLKSRHPIPRLDDHIAFDEGRHVYSVDGMEYRSSVTSFVHSYFDEFDEGRTIRRIVTGSRWEDDATYAYYRMPAEEISRRWEDTRNEASALGTTMHAYIERWYNGQRPADLDPASLGREYEQFHKFHADRVEGKLEPFRTELRLFDREFELAGSVDMLYRPAIRAPDGSDDDTLIMYDWKRSKEIRYHAFDPNDRGRDPVSAMPNCNFEHFCLQLNAYRYLLERSTTWKVKEMHVLCMHPNHPGYIRVRIPDHQKEIRAMCDARKRSLLREDAEQMDRALTRLASAPLGEFTPDLLQDARTRCDRILRMVWGVAK